jgi:hypothetical protein
MSVTGCVGTLIHAVHRLSPLIFSSTPSPPCELYTGISLRRYWCIERPASSVALPYVLAPGVVAFRCCVIDAECHLITVASAIIRVGT